MKILGARGRVLPDILKAMVTPFPFLCLPRRGCKGELAPSSQKQAHRAPLASDAKAEAHREGFLARKKGFVLCLCFLCLLPFSLPSPELLLLQCNSDLGLEGNSHRLL